MTTELPDLREFDTVPKVFWRGVKTRADGTMMRQKEFGIWEAQSWRDVGGVVTEIAMGLIAIGLEPRSTVSILSNTRREWLWSDLAVLSADGIVNGIYPTDSAHQVEYLCSDSGTAFLFVEDEEQLDKFLQVQDRLPNVRKAIVFDMLGLHDLKHERVMSLEGLRERGRTHLAQHPSLLDERTAQGRPEDVAILVYTSGTTGRPKGAMITHANILSTCSGLTGFMPQGASDERMAFLPLCHVAERIGGAYYAIYTGAVLNFVENPDTVPENIREIQPTMIMAVPRIWEKLYSAATIAVKEAAPLQQWLYRRAIGAGERVAREREQGRAPSLGLRLLHRAVRWLVLNNVRRMLGLERARLAFTGGAPISPDLVRWYMALGIDMAELWGMTETTGAGTCNPASRIRPGSIGLAQPSIEIRIAEDGEILVRGPTVFTSYLNQPEKTAAAFVDGWFRTGDMGRRDGDGYFYITDRLKDIIITAGGKNITPSELENQLKFSPYITDAIVIGDRRPYLTCLIMIDQENVEQWAQDNAIPFSDYKSLSRRPEVIELIGREVARVNALFARVEQIKQFRLIENRLTAEDEELTPTMKLKRALVNEKYRDLIESMYRASA